MTNKSYPAQIVFTESDEGNAWHGRLLNPRNSIDTQHHGRPVTGNPWFYIQAGRDGLGRPQYHAIMQGRETGGRRYRTYQTLQEAQRAAIRWAGRRFRILIDE